MMLAVIAGAVSPSQRSTMSAEKKAIGEGHRGGHLQGHSGRDQQPLDHRSPHPPGLELGDHRQHQIDHRQSERLDAV